MLFRSGPHFGKSRVQAWGQEKEQERETKPWTCSLGTNQCCRCGQVHPVFSTPEGGFTISPYLQMGNQDSRAVKSSAQGPRASNVAEGSLGGKGQRVEAGDSGVGGEGGLEEAGSLRGRRERAMGTAKDEGRYCGLWRGFGVRGEWAGREAAARAQDGGGRRQPRH